MQLVFICLLLAAVPALAQQTPTVQFSPAVTPAKVVITGGVYRWGAKKTLIGGTSAITAQSGAGMLRVYILEDGLHATADPGLSIACSGPVACGAGDHFPPASDQIAQVAAAAGAFQPATLVDWRSIAGREESAPAAQPKTYTLRFRAGATTYTIAAADHGLTTPEVATLCRSDFGTEMNRGVRIDPVTRAITLTLPGNASGNCTLREF
jgi:hypothetical protein